MPDQPPPRPPTPAAPTPGGLEPHLLKDVRAVKRRLTDEATVVVGMLESALTALWDLDTQKAGEILSSDERIDREEVAIEEACFRVMTLQAPVARDFRLLTFILKVNADIERVADHACSVSKITFKLADNPPPAWPTSLVELGQRVPMTCHALLRAMHDEDAAASKEIVLGDKTIDRLNRRLFDEVVEFMERHPNSHATGLLLFRIGRELERVGDLMTNIAEDIVYLSTGEIIRHEKKRLRAERERADQP
jgi:phosphate transport system protein